MKATNVIIGLGIVVAGIVGILLYKRMKAKKEAGTTSTQPATNTTTSTTKPAGTSTTTSTQPAASTTGSSTIIGSVKDESKGKMQVTLSISEKGKYKVGDKVKVDSPNLKGIYPIWHIYHGTTAMNLYIDTPYVTGVTSGTVTKV